MMVTKADKERIRTLLSEAITVLCKNGLGYQSEFSVEGLLGITVDKEEIFLVNIKESILKAQQYQDEKNGHDAKSNSGEYSDQDLSFGSTLEGVTGEFIKVNHSSNNSNNNHSNNNRRVTERRGSDEAVINQSHMSGRAQSMGSGIKIEQAELRHEGSGNTNQTAVLTGDLAHWEQGLAGASLTMSQGVAVSAPMVAASISQMSGIAQPTQLDDQRRRSRDHMRRYRQQLRTTNYTEYEDRKRRQREGMRRYRERLRMENPEKYAEMNRKHAEQERRRRMRVRSFSASFAQQATTTHPSLQAAIQTGDGVSVKLANATTDFLHMAMENSQLLPVRDMHQLIQSGFPLPSGVLAGTVGLSSGSTSNAGNALTGLTVVPMEDGSQQQQQQAATSQHSQHLLPREQTPSGSNGGTHLQQHQHLVSSASSLPSHNHIQHSQVLPSSTSTSTSTTSPLASTSSTTHCHQGLRTVPPGMQHGHNAREPPLPGSIEATATSSSH